MNLLKSFLRGAALVVLLIVFLAAWIFLPWPFLLGAAVLFALWMLLTRTGRQAASVTQVGVSTLGQRLGASSVIIVGIAGVVGVLVALLAMAEGYRQTVTAAGNDETAIVLRGGSAAELMSVLSRDQLNAIERAPEIARDKDGRPMASAELVVAANLPRTGGKDDGSVTLRGVGDMAWTVRPNLKLVEGRRFETGRRELVVGKGARKQFQGLEVGKEVRLGNQTWSVVGVFESGDGMESEMWADAEVVATTYRRGSSRASVFAQLTDAKAFKAFKATLKADPRLQVEADTTRGYFGKQSEGITKVLRIIGIIVGSIMAIGAIFGALNTMFATVAARAREIATLRAIGFRPGRCTRWAARLAGVQRLHRLDARRWRGAAELRVQGHAGPVVGGPQVGAGHRLHRRPVPRAARLDPAGHRRPARRLIDACPRDPFADPGSLKRIQPALRDGRRDVVRRIDVMCEIRGIAARDPLGGIQHVAQSAISLHGPRGTQQCRCDDGRNPYAIAESRRGGVRGCELGGVEQRLQMRDLQCRLIAGQQQRRTRVAVESVRGKAHAPCQPFAPSPVDGARHRQVGNGIGDGIRIRADDDHDS